MIISVNSNIVSGLYVVILETFLPLILGLALQKYISIHNLKAILDGNQSLRLTTSRISILSDYGITSNATSRFTSLLGCCVLILTIIGSFAIDGTSRRLTRQVNAPVLCTFTNRSEDLIDFTRHVSEDGRKVSGSYLFSRAAASCIRYRESGQSFFAAVGSLDDVESVTHDQNEFVSMNSSCTHTRNGFENGVQTQENFSDRLEIGPLCGLSVLNMTVRNLSVWSENLTFACADLEALETWCAKFSKFVCVTQFRQDLRYSLSAIYIQPNFFYTETVLSSSRTYITYSQTLKSAAYLLATGAARQLEESFTLSRMSIVKDASVEVTGEVVFETEVSVPLFLGSAGVATVITVLVCLATLLKWREHVANHAMKRKNALSGAMDVMELAAKVAGAGKGEDLVVGVTGDEPRVGLVVGTEVGDTQFEEQNVGGRLRQRRGELVLTAAAAAAYS